MPDPLLPDRPKAKSLKPLRALLPYLKPYRGVALLALAALLLRGAPAQRPALAMLADLGAATLAFGVRVHADGAWQLVGEAVAAAFAVLLTRRWTAARDLGPVLAGAIASACALEAPTPAGHVRAALTLLVPIALVDVGGAAAGRLAGLVLGALLLFFGVRLGDSLSGPLHLWSPIAWVPVAGWLGLCSAIAVRRGCAATANAAHTLLYGGRFAIASLAVWAVALLAGEPLPPHAVPELLAAGLWALGAGAAARAFGAPERFRGHARELVELGGLMVVLAGYCAWAGAIEPTWTRLATLVAVGAALLAARRWLGGGELAVAGAAALGIAAVAPAEPALQSRLQMALVALLPALLVRRGSAGFGAPVGAALGAVAAGLAVQLGHSLGNTLAAPLSWWAPAAGAAAIAWATLAAALRPEPRVALVAACARGAAPFALAVPIVWCAQALLHGWREVHAASGAVLVIGALALGVEAWRAGRASSAAAEPAIGPVRFAVADLGAVLAVLGAFALPSSVIADAGGAVGFDHPWLRLAGIAVAAASVLGTRRWTGASELAPGLAAAIAAFAVLGEPVGAGSRAHAAIALGLLAALVLAARPAALRAAALVAAAAVACFAATRTFAFTGEHALWTSIGLGVAGGLAGGGALVSAWRRDRIGLTTAAVLLCTLGVAWSVIAWQPAAANGDAGPTAFVNLRCLCALLLLALLDFARRRLPAGAAALERGTFVAITLGFAWLAGLVEMLALVRAWPAGWSDATISLYSVLYAAGLLWAGFRRRRPALRYAGLGGFAIVVVKVGLWDLAALALPLRVLVTGVLGVVLLLGAWAYARNRRAPPAVASG
jgi:hypothetical protein